MIEINSEVFETYTAGHRYVRIDWDGPTLIRWMGRENPVKHARTRNSSVYLHPSGLWVRGGKNWVERIDQ